MQRFIHLYPFSLDPHHHRANADDDDDGCHLTVWGRWSCLVCLAWLIGHWTSSDSSVLTLYVHSTWDSAGRSVSPCNDLEMTLVAFIINNPVRQCPDREGQCVLELEWFIMLNCLGIRTVFYSDILQLLYCNVASSSASVSQPNLV